MSFKIALLVFTALVGAQAQSANLTLCSSNRTDAFCNSVSSLTAPSCCAQVYNITRFANGSIAQNATAAQFYCLPVGFVTGTRVPGSVIEVTKYSNGSSMNIQAHCPSTNLTESLCSGGNDASCGGDFCCSSRRANVSVTRPVSGSATVDLTNFCVSKTQNLSWSIGNSSSAINFGLSGSCLKADEIDEGSFASFVKISFALFATVIGLAFF